MVSPPPETHSHNLEAGFRISSDHQIKTVALRIWHCTLICTQSILSCFSTLCMLILILSSSTFKNLRGRGSRFCQHISQIRRLLIFLPFHSIRKLIQRDVYSRGCMQWHGTHAGTMCPSLAASDVMCQPYVTATSWRSSYDKIKHSSRVSIPS